MKYIYVGNGAFIHGVPAKDLSEDEFNALSGELKAAMLASGLYVVERPVERPVEVEKPKFRAKE